MGLHAIPVIGQGYLKGHNIKSPLGLHTNQLSFLVDLKSLKKF